MAVIPELQDDSNCFLRNLCRMYPRDAMMKFLHRVFLGMKSVTTTWKFNVSRRAGRAAAIDGVVLSNRSWFLLGAVSITLILSLVT